MTNRFKGIIRRSVLMEKCNKTRQDMNYYSPEIEAAGLAMKNDVGYIYHEDCVPYLLERKHKTGGGRPKKNGCYIRNKKTKNTAL